MKSRSTLLSIIALSFSFFSTVSLAQSVKSPQVHADCTVTFHLKMPNAQKVELRLDALSGRTALAMAKDAGGLWSITTAPLPPDMYSYLFNIDGLDIIDPDVREYKPSHFLQGGLFTVPGSPAEPWEDTHLPHGAVHHHLYSSTVTGDENDYYVYTPPAFDPTANAKYPVLYLVHGYSDTTDAWTAMGHANLILDNLIAQGKSKPIIVVMPSGYGEPKILDAGWGKAVPEIVRRNHENFSAVLLQEIIPRIEKEYPVEKGREYRAIAGLSMGGALAISAGLNHSRQFAWVGSMSAGTIEDSDLVFPGLNAKEANTLKLLWIACGKEDGLLQTNRELKAWLTAKNIMFTSVETDGGHTWPVWRRNLIRLVPQLFR